ncbi:hypothetical protein [Streptacidiphilus melanogenes]|uniref:hypothetical protein n=1 Tax=Streptacidiphilus melanogenes TaxID=411235 RepID=UPI000A70910A|nr:hypothetical protein [Streptacidiphilus melanogenes]
MFTDYAAMVPQLQTDGLVTAAGRAGLAGTAAAVVSVPAVRRAVRGFLERRVGAR